MIEHLSYQRGGNRTIISGEEKITWKHLCRQLKVDNSFIYQSEHLHFSLDNKKKIAYTLHTIFSIIGLHFETC